MVSSSSLASQERQRRIASFKDRVAALAVTSKVYRLHSDKSITTLDSSTLSSASSKNHTSGNPPAVFKNKNPFHDDDDDDTSSSSSSFCDDRTEGNFSAASILSSGLAKGEVGRVDLRQWQLRDVPDEKQLHVNINMQVNMDKTISGKSSKDSGDDEDSDSSDANASSIDENSTHIMLQEKEERSPKTINNRQMVKFSSNATIDSGADSIFSFSTIEEGSAGGESSVDGELFTGFQELFIMKGKRKQDTWETQSDEREKLEHSQELSNVNGGGHGRDEVILKRMSKDAIKNSGSKTTINGANNINIINNINKSNNSSGNNDNNKSINNSENTSSNITNISNSIDNNKNGTTNSNNNNSNHINNSIFNSSNNSNSIINNNNSTNSLRVKQANVSWNDKKSVASYSSSSFSGFSIETCSELRVDDNPNTHVTTRETLRLLDKATLDAPSTVEPSVESKQIYTHELGERPVRNGNATIDGKTPAIVSQDKAPVETKIQRQNKIEKEERKLIDLESKTMRDETKLEEINNLEKGIVASKERRREAKISPASTFTTIKASFDTQMGEKSNNEVLLAEPVETIAAQVIKPLNNINARKWKKSTDSFESSSFGSSDTPSASLPETSFKDSTKSENQFADIFAKRAQQKAASYKVFKKFMSPTRTSSDINLESSSQESASENSSAMEKNELFVFEDTDKVKSNHFDDDEVDQTDVLSFLESNVHWHGNDKLADIDSTNKVDSVDVSSDNSDESTSLEGAIFSDLKKALSRIQSVSYEAMDEENDETSVDNYGDQPKIILSTGESCAVSSLKDVDYFEATNDYIGMLDVDAFEDDDDILSVPKSPASLEQSENHNESIQEPMQKFIETQHMKEETILLKDDGGKSSGNILGNVLQTNSTEERVYKESMKERETNLSPPKKSVVLSDGSISTKDSILGKTIRVTNADMVAERIYLESLRAQVHAELKVHVADEEIRLALETRLQAIRDFYKRKATVSQLRTSFDDDILEKVASLPPQKFTTPANKPKILREENIEQIQAYSTSVVSSVSYPKGIVMNTSSKSTQRHIFERAQAKINEAIKEANISCDQRPAYDKVEEEERENVEIDVKNEVSMKRSESPIPVHIFTQDTYWDDEEGVIPVSFSQKAFTQTHSLTMRNAWSFYRLINSLISESRAYEYEFQIIQEDPLYPYLNSLVGISDSGNDGNSREDKKIKQQIKTEYRDKSPHRICDLLSKEASKVLPKLKAMCAHIGRKLGLMTMAVARVKRPSVALIKSEKKYGGNPLLVTDYCRASLFVPDIATILALIEIVLSKYSNSIKRIKLSNLKSDHLPLIGGYRDCKINVEINGHICEIQVHLESLWNIRKENGYSHYKKCCENHVNISAFDVSRTLIGLDREFLSDLIKVGEDAIKSVPANSLTYNSEEQIRDYSALTSLYLYYGLPVRAEHALRQIIKLRTESHRFGPGHDETLIHLKMLKKALKMQHKYRKSHEVSKRINRAEKQRRDEPDLLELCSHDQCGALDHLIDSVLDPSKKERLEEKQKLARVDESRAIWLSTRKRFFN